MPIHPSEGLQELDAETGLAQLHGLQVGASDKRRLVAVSNKLVQAGYQVVRAEDSSAGLAALVRSHGADGRHFALHRRLFHQLLRQARQGELANVRLELEGSEKGPEKDARIDRRFRRRFLEQFRAERIVLASGGGIRQDLVRLVELLELLVGFGTRIFVWMHTHCFFVIRFLDVLRGGCGGHAEDVIIRGFLYVASAMASSSLSSFLVVANLFLFFRGCKQVANDVHVLDPLALFLVPLVVLLDAFGEGFRRVGDAANDLRESDSGACNGEAHEASDALSDAFQKSQSAFLLRPNDGS